MLTQAQRITLHADAIAQPSLATALANGDDQIIADFYNTMPTPSFIAWRTSVTKEEYQNSASPSATIFSWSGTGGYIARTQGERDAWRALFEPGGIINPAQANVITAFNDIFSGSGSQAVNNRAHLLALSKRSTTLAEKLLAIGEGSDAAPARMTFEGVVTVQEAGQIRAGE